ncbi:MAG: hypothetical protein RLZZ69_1582 [Cyanobacteriota bacterium]
MSLFTVKQLAAIAISKFNLKPDGKVFDQNDTVRNEIEQSQ